MTGAGGAAGGKAGAMPDSTIPALALLVREAVVEAAAARRARGGIGGCDAAVEGARGAPPRCRVRDSGNPDTESG